MYHDDFEPFNGNEIDNDKNSGTKVHTLTELCLRALSRIVFCDGKSYKIYSTIKENYFAKITRSILDMARHKCHGYVYGGYLRDLIAGEISNKIDIHFEDGDDRDMFLDKFLKNFDVTHLYKLKKYGSKYYLIKHKIFKDFILELRLSVSYERVEILFQEPHYCPEVYEERNYDPPARNYDVDTLDWDYTGIYTPSNNNCIYKDVIKNCQNKQFIVLDRHFNPTISHDHDKICGCSRAECNLKNLCIERDSEEGRYIIYDMINMKERGWICLNQICTNPRCILACEEPVKKFTNSRRNTKLMIFNKK